MLSSSEVSQMMGQQNQLFASQAAFSHQISQQMPSYDTPGQGFSYGGMGSANIGSDFGSRVGGGATSALGGAANFALGAGSIMGGFGMLGKTGRALMDPFAGGGAGWGFAKSRGMGFAGRAAFGALGAAPVFTGIMAAGKAIGYGMAGAQEQARVESALGGVKLAGGQEFGRSGAKHIGNMMREMQALPEMMTSMSELTRVMDKMNQVGMMSGASGVTDFGKKFKDGINTLKTMSKVMGSTMEEAIPMFAEIQNSGFYSNASILEQTMKRQMVGGMTGMGQGQVAQLAMGGSQMGYSMGGTRAAGASHALRVASQLGVANSMGIIGDDQIREMTGMGGAQGLQALSQQFTETSYRMARGRTGKAYTAALAETDEEGRFTGRMDEDKMERFRSGQYTTKDIRRMSRAALKSKKARMSWRANPGLTAEMASNLGAEGQFAMMENALGEKGFDDPDAAVIVGQKFGMSAQEAKQRVSMARSMGDIGNQVRLEGQKIARRKAQEAVMKDNFSMDAVKNRISKRIEGVVEEPLKRLGSDIRDSITTTVDDFVDDLTGKYKVQVSEGLAQLHKGTMMGLGDSQKRMADLRMNTGAMRSRIQGVGADMTAGTMARGAAWLGGVQTSGQKYADRLENILGDRMKTFSDGGSVRGRRARGEHVISRDKNFLQDDVYKSVSQEDLDAGFVRMQNIGSNLEDADVSSLRANMNEEQEFAVRARASYIRTTKEYQDIKDPQERVEFLAKKVRDSGIYKEDKGDWASAPDRVRRKVSGLRMAGGSPASAIELMAAAGALTSKDRQGVASLASITHIGAGGMADFAQSTEKMEKKFLKGLSQKEREAWESLDKDIGSGTNKLLQDVLAVGEVEAASRDSRGAATDTFLAMEALRLSGEDVKGRKFSNLERHGKGGSFDEYGVQGELNRIALKAAEGKPITAEDAALVNSRQEQYDLVKRQKMGQTALKAIDDGKPLTAAQRRSLEDDFGIPDPNNMSSKDIEKVQGVLDTSYTLSHLSGSEKKTALALLGRKWSMGLTEIDRKTALEGGSRRGVIRELRGRGTLSKEANTWLDRFEKSASLQAMAGSDKGYLKAMGLNEKGEKVGQNWAEIQTSAVSDLLTRQEKLRGSKKEEDKEELETLNQMVDALTREDTTGRFGATYGALGKLRRKSTRKGKGGKKRGATMEEMFGKDYRVRSKLSSTQLEEFEKKHFAGPDGQLQAMDEFGNKLSLSESQKALEAAMGGAEMTALSGASGTETKSKYALESEVAEKMKEFVGGVNTLATIITGKEPEKSK